jgi:hypothetical protein
MAAEDALNLKQFFHGTYEELNVGDVLVPGSERGIQNFPPAGDNTFVHLTDASHRAHMWASDAARKHNKKTVYVYEVDPHTDPVQNDGMPGYQTTSATIKSLKYKGPRRHK